MHKINLFLNESLQITKMLNEKNEKNNQQNQNLMMKHPIEMKQVRHKNSKKSNFEQNSNSKFK